MYSKCVLLVEGPKEANISRRRPILEEMMNIKWMGLREYEEIERSNPSGLAMTHCHSMCWNSGLSHIVAAMCDRPHITGRSCDSYETGLSRGLRVHTYTNNHVNIVLMYIIHVGKLNSDSVTYPWLCCNDAVRHEVDVEADLLHDVAK